MYTFISAPIFHAAIPPYCCRLNGSNRLLLRLRLSQELAVENVYVRTAPEGEERFIEAARKPQSEAPELAKRYDNRWEWWEAYVEVDVPLLHYRFCCVTAKGNLYFNAKGLCSFTPLDRDDFKVSLVNEPPEWVQDSIFYQIFPERFCCGDSSTNVKDGEYTLAGKTAKAFAWSDPVDQASGNCSFYGGDLPGITSKLDYLCELGVNALYLTPIFTSPSNHKYDVADYYNVDPHFGGNKALAQLRQATKDRHMRLVLDLVPNHCGDHNEWFKKARQDKNAPEYSFFTFYNDNPDQYEMWLGVSTLPRLNYRSQELRRRMYADRDSIMRRWLREPYSVDGWRLDVANMLARQKMDQLGHEIGREMRQAVKEEAPQTWLLGEQFFDPSDYQQGDEFDASMNYRAFCIPMNQWMAGFDFEAFKGKGWGDKAPLADIDLVEQMQSFRAAIPEKNALNMLNLLGSHDLPRVRTFNQGKSTKASALYIFMFAYQGVPCIYYGDEIGMEGGKDPDNRRPMIWDQTQWHSRMLAIMEKLCAARKQVESLRRGGLQWLYAEGGSLAFMREGQGPRAICAITRENRPIESSESGVSTHTAISVKAAALPEGTRFRGVIYNSTAVVKDGMLSVIPKQIGGAEIWVEEID